MVRQEWFIHASCKSRAIGHCCGNDWPVNVVVIYDYVRPSPQWWLPVSETVRLLNLRSACMFHFYAPPWRLYVYVHRVLFCESPRRMICQ